MIISYEQERKMNKALLEGSGLNSDEADLLGKVVAHSDFTGVYSHGMSRMTAYLGSFSENVINPKADIEVISDVGSTVVVDCHNGSGILSAIKTYKLVLEKARQTGIAIGVARRGSNLGCGSYYGWMAAEDNVMCITCCNTPTSMAPFGGADSLIGTNPIIAAVPSGEEYPLVMDISTSGVAMGKVAAYAREGKKLPEGWANDKDGNPTTDAKAAYTVLPIAQHKGYGLAVMVDAFSAFLSSAMYGSNIGNPMKGEYENTGFCIIIVDPSKFRPIEEFKADVDNYVRMIKGSKPKEGVSEIFMPGEIEFKKFAKSKEEGYDVSDALAAELLQYAKKFNIATEDDTFESFIAKL